VTPQELSALIRRAIREGVYLPGQELVQSDLAARLGVSRVPLREALRILAGEGLLTFRQGQGAVVTKLDAAEIEDLYDLRLKIEPDLAAGIIEHCSGSHLARFRELLDRMSEVEDSQRLRWAEINYEFHTSMYRLANRRQTMRIIEQLLHLTESYARIYVTFMVSPEDRRSQHEHQAMLDAIEKRDAQSLANVIRVHVERARDGLLTAMRQTPDVLDPLQQLIAKSE
jgi:DNA-binding GntR family transcriptional regulator